MHALAHHDSIEAPCLWRHGSNYYLFVNWGLCCRGTNRTYTIRVGRSAQITGPYLDRDGVNMLHDGGSAFLESSGPSIGPGHAGIFTEGGTNWSSFHFYDARRRGAASLGQRLLQWDAGGWPVLTTQTR